MWSRTLPTGRSALELIDATNALLQKYDLTTEKSKSCTEELRDKAEFLLNCSKKELAGKRLSDEEYSQVESIGSAFEYITPHLIQQTRPISARVE